MECQAAIAELILESNHPRIHVSTQLSILSCIKQINPKQITNQEIPLIGFKLHFRQYQSLSCWTNLSLEALLYNRNSSQRRLKRLFWFLSFFSVRKVIEPSTLFPTIGPLFFVCKRRQFPGRKNPLRLKDEQDESSSYCHRPIDFKDIHRSLPAN